MESRVKLSSTSIILLLGFIVGLLIIFTTQNSFGGADSIQHFSLAKWGWKYPELLFNHWGKPVFTILISPFAQFGFAGAQVYNLLFGILTSLVIWKIAKQLDMPNNEFSPLLVIATPVYFVLMYTSLTEVTFSFFISLSILFFFKKKYYYSAILFSLLPLIRTEGIVLLPLFAGAFLLKKQFIPILFFTTGFWIISFLGYPFFDDFWWLITRMPYSGGASDIYGSGSWYHFIYNTSDERAILGKLLGTLFILSVFILLLNWVKKDKFKFTDRFFFIILIPGSFIIFFVAHSFVWWQGMGNSLGLLRVIGSVTPLAALTSLIALGLLIDWLSKFNKSFGTIVGYGIVAVIFIFGLKDYRSTFKPSAPQEVLIDATDYISENKLLKHRLYYFNPYVPYKLGVDPNDHTNYTLGLSNTTDPAVGIPDSSLIVWDAHFGPNEGRISLDALEGQKTLELIAEFKAEIPFKVLGGHDYEVRIYRKNISLSDNLKNKVVYDYNKQKSDDDISRNGTPSFHFTKKVNYSDGMVAYLEELLDTISSFEVNVSGYIYSGKIIEKEIPIVCSLYEDGGNEIYYKTANLKDDIIDYNGWNPFYHTFLIPNINSLDKLLKVYIWNNNSLDFYIDDLVFEINSIGSKTYDFESSIFGDSSISYGGIKSRNILPNTTYSNGIEMPLYAICDSICNISLVVSGYIYYTDTISNELPLICSVQIDDEILIYQSYNLKDTITEANEWNYFENSFLIVDINSSDAIIKSYIWNMNHDNFYIDDLVFEMRPN